MSSKPKPQRRQGVNWTSHEPVTYHVSLACGTPHGACRSVPALGKQYVEPFSAVCSGGVLILDSLPELDTLGLDPGVQVHEPGRQVGDCHHHYAGDSCHHSKIGPPSPRLPWFCRLLVAMASFCEAGVAAIN